MIIPDDMIEASGKIFAGEYDVEIYSRKQPVILDIGANIGSFSRWAKYRWPESTIYAYEPSPHCFDFLSENTKDLNNVKCFKVAICKESGSAFLYDGTQNRGMSSMLKTEYARETGSHIATLSAAELPRADIVKCDTEGMELEILTNLLFQPELILVEYHSLEAKKTLEDYYSKDYMLYEYKLMSYRAGSLKFIHNDAPVGITR